MSTRGAWFDKRAWDGAPLPAWPAVRERLPDPVYDERPSAVAAYWKGWELAIRGMRSPAPGSGLVSNHLFFVFNDAENGAIFAHDSALMTMYGRFGHRVFPAIETLDNFYARQHDTGEICREIRHRDGADVWPNDEVDPMTVRLEGPWERHGGDWSKVRSYRWTRPTLGAHPPARCRVDAYTDHKFHWAEWLNYKITGVASRLERVLQPLEYLYAAYTVYLRDRNGLYITDWAGMDNSPRNDHLGYGVDLSAQMVYFARVLADIADVLNEPAKARAYRDEAEQAAARVRALMWNPATGLFHDRRFDGGLAPVKTVMGFAPLQAGIPDADQLSGLVAQLENPATFNRPVRVPSLAADEPDYVPWGEYYFGGVWPYTNAMVVEGLETCGEPALASAIARNYWSAAVEIFERTGTVWEYFAPEAAEPGRGHNPADPGKNARRDFAGWGAYPVIATFLEHGIGLRADAPARTLVWNLRSTGRCGCRRFPLGEIDVDLIGAARADADAEPVLETATATAPCTLVLRWAPGRERTLALGPAG
ncbi:MAG TPA: trehalase family glycosidase [Kiritimatiellia bacterium]|nr:trehalase family glycosidase [Kiritimatiellia bacterium]